MLTIHRAPGVLLQPPGYRHEVSNRPSASGNGRQAESIGGPRDHLANERTQLAWLRTGANVMVVGLAVARFADEGDVTIASLVAGGLLVLAGTLGIGYGTVRYRRIATDLREGTSARVTSSAGPSIAAAVLVLAVIAAAAILLAAA